MNIEEFIELVKKCEGEEEVDYDQVVEYVGIIFLLFLAKLAMEEDAK